MKNTNLNNIQRVRAENISLLRHLNGGHEPLAKKLNGIVNWNYLSKMCLGDMPVEDSVARQSEQRLNQPAGWLDRQIRPILNATDEDWLLISQILALPPEAKSIARLIAAYAAKRGEGE